MSKTDDRTTTVGSSDEDGSYRLTVTYATVVYDGTHKVTIRDNYHDWVDIAMAHTELNGLSLWTTDLVTPPDQGPVYIEFKLVLDGAYWMRGLNQSGTTSRPSTTIDYDDDSVVWDR